MTAKLISLVIVFELESVRSPIYTLIVAGGAYANQSLCALFFRHYRQSSCYVTLLSCSACAGWKTVQREIHSHQLHPQLHTVFKKEKAVSSPSMNIVDCEIITILMNVNIDDP